MAACLCACVWLESIVPMCFKTTAVIATEGGGALCAFAQAFYCAFMGRSLARVVVLCPMTSPKRQATFRRTYSAWISGVAWRS